MQITIKFVRFPLPIQGKIKGLTVKRAEELEQEADERAAEIYGFFLNGTLSGHSAAGF